MNALDFGRQLVKTRDLDPIYVMLNRAGLDWETRARFCLAYWMFYHAGVAARIADPDEDFWEGCWLAYDNKWPRGTERRHFRGPLAQSSIRAMEQYAPEPKAAVTWVIGCDDRPLYYLDVMKRVQEFRGFGPWIAFKVADMVDAVLDVEVDFRGAEKDFFDDPVKGGCWVAMETMGMEFDHITFNDRYRYASVATRQVHLKGALNYLAEGLGTMVCPHNPTRTLRLQEYETILCKYKSHLNGHYEPGHDTKEILKALEWPHGFNPRSELATRLRESLQEATR